MWQPIETAPREGWIWAFVPMKYAAKKGAKKKLLPPQQVPLVWCERIEPENGWQPSNRAVDLVGKHGGYWSFSRKGKPMHGEPTHWMPFPEPPQ